MSNELFFRGSLGHQMMEILKAIYKPGKKRHLDKKHKRDSQYIRSIGSMKTKVSDLFTFSRYIKKNFPQIKKANQITPEIAENYIQAMIDRNLSDGYVARVASSLRKFDIACRKIGITQKDAPLLLPYEITKGFRSEPSTLAYSREDAKRIISWVKKRNPDMSIYLMVMCLLGLRASEGAYLHRDNINLETYEITLFGNKNRTKGGRPRSYIVDETNKAFLEILVNKADSTKTGHIFINRRSRAKKARNYVRNACEELKITPLGLHGFRKTFAVHTYRQAIMNGLNIESANNIVTQSLGHNRLIVVRQSYIDREILSL